MIFAEKGYGGGGVEPIATCRPSRRTADAPSEPRTNHRSVAEARGDTTRVGTICRVAAT